LVKSEQDGGNSLGVSASIRSFSNPVRFWKFLEYSIFNKPDKAKEPLVYLIREARAMKFSGQELADAEGLLSSL
jgi:hypothetical protein